VPVAVRVRPGARCALLLRWGWGWGWGAACGWRCASPPHQRGGFAYRGRL